MFVQLYFLCFLIGPLRSPVKNVNNFLESDEYLGRHSELKGWKLDSAKKKWLDDARFVGKGDMEDGVKERLWNLAEEDLINRKRTKGWDLADSDLDFSRDIGGIEGLAEKWDTADEDLLKINGGKDLHVKGLIEQWDVDSDNEKNIRRKHLAEEWKSGDINSLKIKPMSFTEPETYKREWRQASRINLIDDLNDMAEIQWKIISALKKVEHNSKESNNCNLRDLAQQKAAIADLETSLDLDREPPGTSHLFQR